MTPLPADPLSIDQDSSSLERCVGGHGTPSLSVLLVATDLLVKLAEFVTLLDVRNLSSVSRKLAAENVPQHVRRAIVAVCREAARCQGDDLDLLFRALLGSLEGRGLISRMKEPPVVATNPSRFHAQFWAKFVDQCSEPWTEMSPQKKRERLRDWMYQKFSLDPKSRCMLPGRGCKRKKRNEACWSGFELTDADLEHVLGETMETYLMGRS